MELSTRNQLRSTVKEVKSDGIMSEIILDVGGQEMCATITSGSVNRLKIKPGDQVTALVKASSVMLMKY